MPLHHENLYHLLEFRVGSTQDLTVSGTVWLQVQYTCKVVLLKENWMEPISMRGWEKIKGDQEYDLYEKTSIF